MSWSSHHQSLWRSWLFSIALLVPAVLPAAEPDKHSRGQPKPQPQVVDVFDGIKDGRIEVRWIAKDATKSRLLVTNKTDKPLAVQLPAAVAAVPVLAQFRDFNRGNFNQNNVPQPVGGGPDWNQRQPAQMNVRQPAQNRPNWFPGLQFNIAPEQVARLKLTTVCLEYGKPKPNARIQYTIKPIDEVADKPGVARICAMLAQGKLPQRVAQLAAWHLGNDMSWDALGDLKTRATFGQKARYPQQEIAAAKKAVEHAVGQAEVRSAKTRRSSGTRQ